MEWLPSARVAVLKVAFRLLSVLLPRTVVPFLNVTVPVGVPDKVGVTVAVKVTDLPTAAGFKDDSKLVVLVEIIEKLADLVLSTFPALSLL